MSRRPPLPPPALILGVRIRAAAILISIAFLILLLRLWTLQVLEGERYFSLSTNNRLRIRPVEAPRGFILDRNRQLIVENRPTFDLFVTPEDVGNLDDLAAVLGPILGTPAEALADRIRSGMDRPYDPVLIQKAIDTPTMVAIEERRLDLPGVSLRVRPVRAYPTGGLAANLLGYVSEVNQAQLQREEYEDFRPGENLGQAGVERRFDAFLRGVDGGEQMEVDARGRVLRLLDRVDPRSGSNLVLTIDRRIQAAAEEAFQGKNGAVVALDPRTGEILAMVSRPSYDPNLFAQRITPEEWQRIAADPKHPFQNRVFQAQYPPGSVFKLVTAIAGLESGALTPQTRFSCPGYFYLGNVRFECWKKGGHGTLDLRGAIANSCNVYFYNAALKIGIEEISRVAREFGLGQPPGLGLGDEARGTVPAPDPPRKGGDSGWFPGMTVMAGIGQGAIAVSPIQVATMVAAIANGGRIYRPLVVRRVESLDGQAIEQYEPELLRQVNIKPETLAIIRQGMLAVVNEGTGARARVPGLQVAGKTGTAQVVRKGEGAGRSELKDHGWFVAFAPFDRPTIAIAVLAENAGFGGINAAPVAKAMLEAAFKTPAPGAAFAAARARQGKEAGPLADERGTQRSANGGLGPGAGDVAAAPPDGGEIGD